MTAITARHDISGERFADVHVAVMDFAALGAQSYYLKLDNYQRPYVWSRQKVEQLLDDLSAFSAQDQMQEYYLGTLLLHRDDRQEARFVIDGQQRLSSLAVLFHYLQGALPPGFDFRYRSPVSADNLLRAKEAVKAFAPGFDVSIFSRLHFTVITVTREDLAFTFFDTQNSRGVPLAATDLLKAYHLRAIAGEEEQVGQMQQSCARWWEAVQMAGPRDDEKRRDFAPSLFGQYLWRARDWRGQRRFGREDHDSILTMFQERSVGAEAVDSVPLYPGHANQSAVRLRLDRGEGYHLEPGASGVAASPADLPFSLRQPIHKGAGFFLYAQKYAALLDELLYRPAPNHEIALVRTLYSSVVAYNSPYLRELFKLALLGYADRFGPRRLLEFAQRTELVLGGLRFEKQSIYKEAPLKFLRDAGHNLLDVIPMAYRPDEVMEFLQAELAGSPGYGDEYLGRVVAGKGVQGRYLSAARAYFGALATLPSGVAPWLQRLAANDK